MIQNTQKNDALNREFLGDVNRIMSVEGISQADLACRLTVTPSYVSKILSGRANPTVSTLLKIANALGTTLSVRLALEDGETAAPQCARGAADQKEDPVVSLEPSILRQADEVAVRQLLEKLPPEAAASITARYGKGERRKRGRPKGSGMIDDTLRLERMAELLVAGMVRSVRQAARQVAKDDPGHSEKSTARRLRRKFAEDRPRLLTVARSRRELTDDEGTGRRPLPPRSDRPSVWSRRGSSRPVSLGEETEAFLADLQREFQIDRETVELLRTPHTLEKLAELQRPETDLAEMTSPLSNPMALEETAAEFLDRMTSPYRDISRADALVTATRSPAALAATDWSLVGSDITGIEATTRVLDVAGELDRRVRRLMGPRFE